MTAKKYGKDFKTLWAEFGDIPCNSDEEIEEAFYIFEIGIERPVGDPGIARDHRHSGFGISMFSEHTARSGDNGVFTFSDSGLPSFGR